MSCADVRINARAGGSQPPALAHGEGKKMGDGFVYAMGADELGNLVKIGWSDAPER